MKVYDWRRRLLDGLFPPTCRLCAARAGHAWSLCAGCAADLPVLARQCTQCARPLPGDGLATRCGRCQRSSPPFERTRAPFAYQAPLDYLIKQLKFHDDPGMAPLLARLLAEHVQQGEGPLPGLLVPVPLHPARLRERGFNQAIELARPLGRMLDIAVNIRLCRRTRETVAQSQLAPTARRLNVRNAFAVAGALPAAHVAIVDDVMTTGYTAAELARVLALAGAERIEVWVVARAG